MLYFQNITNHQYINLFQSLETGNFVSHFSSTLFSLFTAKVPENPFLKIEIFLLKMSEVFELR